VSTDESSGAPTSAAVITSTLTALAGASGHAPEAILVAAGAAALQPAFGRVCGWIGDVFSRGAANSGRSVEELIAVLDSSPEKQELYVRSIETARSASLETKRAAIASALAEGTASDAAAVRATDFLRIVADLDLAHVQALRIPSEPRSLPMRSAFLGANNFDPTDLGEVDPALRSSEERLLAVLRSHGLAEHATQVETFGPTTTAWHITTFGREVLARYAPFPSIEPSPT